MKQEAFRTAAYTVECKDYVHVVEFNPFDCGTAESLIAYGGNNYVVVGTCRFQVSIHYNVYIYVKVLTWKQRLHFELHLKFEERAFETQWRRYT